MATRKKPTNPTLATQRKGQRKATRKASELTSAEKKALGRLPRKALVGIIVGLVAALGGAAAVGVNRLYPWTEFEKERSEIHAHINSRNLATRKASLDDIQSSKSTSSEE